LLTIYRDPDGSIRDKGPAELPSDVIWIDLVNPTDDEKAFVEKRTRMRIPTVDALSEIESSSRQRLDHAVIYLSTPVVARGDTAEAFLTPAGFVLTKSLLVTVRFEKLTTFDQVAERIRSDETLRSAFGVFTALLEALVDRGADVLERLGADLDLISRSVFRANPREMQRSMRSTRRLRRTLTSVGVIGERLSLARDALLGLGRIPPFVQGVCHDWTDQDVETRLGAIARDITSLNDFEGHLSNKVQFLLDAILGFITIEQNDLFKILTIVSVAGIPPVLIAGIYGMNFKVMPELNWTWGYPAALVAIVISAVLPVLWFKWRGWFD
jgi:magnesium transporter